MSKLESLSNEEKLLVLASRITFSDNVNEEIHQLIKSDLDWFDIYNMAIKNKVLSLVYYNLCELGYKNKIPSRLDQLAKFFLKGTERHNKVYFQELEKVSFALKNANIPFTLLKGAFFIPEMYKHFGIRTMNDIDCLINYSNTEKIKKTMNDIGYKQMDYDRGLCRLKEINRQKDLLWKMSMNNLLPFRKIVDDDFCNVVAFDFSFSLDLKRQFNIVELMIDRAVVNGGKDYLSLKNTDFFIHLCSHLYKEATNVEWIALNGDLNIIKFCDIREYVLHYMDQNSLKDAINFANENDLKEAVYYTLYYLREMYGDGYEEDLLSLIEIEDYDFIHFYGKREYGEELSWNKTFWQRIFSSSNRDELKEKPKFMNFYY